MLKYTATTAAGALAAAVFATVAIGPTETAAAPKQRPVMTDGSVRFLSGPPPQPSTGPGMLRSIDKGNTWSLNHARLTARPQTGTRTSIHLVPKLRGNHRDF